MKLKDFNIERVERIQLKGGEIAEQFPDYEEGLVELKSKDEESCEVCGKVARLWFIENEALVGFCDSDLKSSYPEAEVVDFKI